jgi:hypothetical protein
MIKKNIQDKKDELKNELKKIIDGIKLFDVFVNF